MVLSYHPAVRESISVFVDYIAKVVLSAGDKMGGWENISQNKKIGSAIPALPTAFQALTSWGFTRCPAHGILNLIRFRNLCVRCHGVEQNQASRQHEPGDAAQYFTDSHTLLPPGCISLTFELLTLSPFPIIQTLPKTASPFWLRNLTFSLKGAAVRAARQWISILGSTASRSTA